MPIYEYECKSCNHRFEQLQKITEPPLSNCPECQKNTLVKLISNTSFQLKGSGWYVTDFKSKNEGGGKAKPDSTKPSKKEEKSASEKPKNIEKK